MKIEQINISQLKLYERNSRTHSPAQVAQIAASITEFGFTNPVLISSEGKIIAGHGRYLAAIKLGLEVIPCIRLEGLSPAQIRAYVIADNKLAENAGWDIEILRLELGALLAMEFNIDLLGFGQDELEKLLKGMGSGGLTDEDEVPDPPEEPVTIPGDIWLLGQHRIICGSSTDQATVAALLSGAVPHLMVTDPPYGVKYDPEWRKKSLGATGGAMGKVLNDNRADWREAWALFPGDVAYVWHASNFTNLVAESLASCSLEVRSQIIWAKSQLVISRGNYHPQHEPCWYAVRKGRKAHWNGSRRKSTLWRDIDTVLRPGEEVFVRRFDNETAMAISSDHSTVWEIPKPQKSETGHSTQKPVECMRRPILNNSKLGEAIYEPFSGSGTTIIAAEQTGRICYAVELSPAYIDVAVQRWENFTGLKAELIKA